jgi:hypothetical protein
VTSIVAWSAGFGSHWFLLAWNRTRTAYDPGLNAKENLAVIVVPALLFVALWVVMPPIVTEHTPLPYSPYRFAPESVSTVPAAFMDASVTTGGGLVLLPYAAAAKVPSVKAIIAARANAFSDCFGIIRSPF